MVIYEFIEGTDLVRAYSDNGVKIRGGNPVADYNEAVDPSEKKRIYEETEIPIDTDETEATIDDYEAALIKLGVKTDEEE